MSSNMTGDGTSSIQFNDFPSEVNLHGSVMGISPVKIFRYRQVKDQILPRMLQLLGSAAPKVKVQAAWDLTGAVSHDSGGK